MTHNVSRKLIALSSVSVLVLGLTGCSLFRGYVDWSYDVGEKMPTYDKAYWGKKEGDPATASMNMDPAMGNPAMMGDPSFSGAGSMPGQPPAYGMPPMDGDIPADPMMPQQPAYLPPGPMIPAPYTQPYQGPRFNSENRMELNESQSSQAKTIASLEKAKAAAENNEASQASVATLAELAPAAGGSGDTSRRAPAGNLALKAEYSRTGRLDVKPADEKPWLNTESQGFRAPSEVLNPPAMSEMKPEENSFPNLATVPPAPEYTSRKESMRASMNELTHAGRNAQRAKSWQEEALLADMGMNPPPPTLPRPVLPEPDGLPFPIDNTTARVQPLPDTSLPPSATMPAPMLRDPGMEPMASAMHSHALTHQPMPQPMPMSEGPIMLRDPGDMPAMTAPIYPAPFMAMAPGEEQMPMMQPDTMQPMVPLILNNPEPVVARTLPESRYYANGQRMARATGFAR